MRWLALLTLLWSLSWSTGALAHRPSDAVLTLEARGTELSGHWEVALRDLATLIDLDRDRDRQLSWGELRVAQPELGALLAQQLALRADDVICPLRFDDLLINDRSDGRYAWFALSARCATPPKQLTLDYRLLFDIDPTHRGIVVLRSGATAHSAVFAPETASQSFVLDAPSAWKAFRDYLVQGVHHIWIGTDHILFLLALLLPVVLRFDAGQWQAQARLRPVVLDVLAVVTAFTFAHSITLSLAALEVVRLPGVWVESAIAASVLLAALNNLRPLVRGRRWAVALGFGLIHGFGFATVLGELGLPPGLRLLALFAFNLGVELGQLAIVAVALPLAFLVRHTRFYRSGVRVVGSLAVALLAAWWLVDRLKPLLLA